MKLLIINLIVLLALGSGLPVAAQEVSRGTTYEKIEMLSPVGEKVREIDVRVRFYPDSMDIESKDSGKVLKSWKYSDITGAEYSYTKNPRWKTGLGLGAASIVFPPLLLVALPVAFTKHRRHWLTIQTDKDFAVLKLSKSNRKLFIPAFETHSSVKVIAQGDNK